MIDLTLVRKPELTSFGFKRKLKQIKRRNVPQIIVFPENTFRKKFIQDDLHLFLRSLKIREDNYVFFSAFSRKSRNLDDVSILDAFLEGENGIARINDSVYKNYGYLLKLSNDKNFSFERYEKTISTEYDAHNTFNSEGSFGASYSSDYNPSIGKVEFPNLTINNRRFDFRLCADIECGVKNLPEITICSAYSLENVRGRMDSSIRNGVLIVNDVCTPIEESIYENGEPSSPTNILERYEINIKRG